MIARTPTPKTALGTIIMVDTIETLDEADIAALAALGVDVTGGYLDRITPAELAARLTHGMGFAPFGYAHESALVAQCRALDIPAHTTVWQDVEGELGPAAALIERINVSGKSLVDATYGPGGYFGALELLTSTELTDLVISRYMKGCSSVRDRFGNAAEPTRGYCVIQERPPNRIVVNGKAFDVSSVSADYHDDLPLFAYAT